MRFDRFLRIQFVGKARRKAYRSGIISLLVGSFILSTGQLASAQLAAAPAQTTLPYCQQPAATVTQTQTLRQAAISGDRTAQANYKALLSQNAAEMQRCRSQSWLKEQAIWLRLYPCDVQSGAIEEILDRIVSHCYNQVYLEVFSDGQVLLPQATNRTAWGSVLRFPGYETRDLLAETIAKGHERGLKIYAWMFTLNFGYTYGQRPDSQQVLALDGYGYTSLNVRSATGSPEGDSNEAFVDPYNLRAQQDYAALEQAILQHQPDGVLFDYVRYPRGTGSASVASRVQDLWIYGSAAQQALYDRASNQKGLELIRRYVTKGQLTTGDISEVNTLYPHETAPLWQGRTPPASASIGTLQTELWRLSVAHAVQGVLDFLAKVVQPVQQRGIPAGAVFFPDANQPVGQQGYDSRLQPWDRFPGNLEWHPMAYANCGTADCIVAQVQRVISLAPSGTQIEPAIAGTWGQVLNNRPALEAQMQAIHQAAPQITSISHFAFSWQDPQYDRDRKFCRLQ
jgi:Glycosyl hydrolase-like 10